MNWRRYCPTYIAYAAGVAIALLPSWWSLVAIFLVTLSQLSMDRVIRRANHSSLPEARVLAEFVGR